MLLLERHGRLTGSRLAAELEVSERTVLRDVEELSAVSMILASGLVAALAARLRVSTTLIVGMLGAGLMTTLLALVGSVWGMIAILFALGWFVTPVQAATVTLLQRNTTDGGRGRVAAAFNASMSTTSIVSMAAAGIFADVIGIRGVFLAGGLVACLGALVAWLLFRSAPANDPRPAARVPAADPA